MPRRPSRDGAADGGERVHLNCPRCGLTIRPRAPWLTIEHCPRCLARSRTPVALFASTLPAAELNAADRLPAMRDDDPALRGIVVAQRGIVERGP